MAGRLAGKVAFITGASRGLGQYCAVEYGKEGAIVAVAARTESVTDPLLPGTIDETAKMVDEAGGEGFPVVCNVGDPASIEAAVAAVLAKYGRIDILMNNAAVQPPGGISANPAAPLGAGVQDQRARVVPLRARRVAEHAGPQERQHHQHLLGGGTAR